MLRILTIVCFVAIPIASQAEQGSVDAFRIHKICRDHISAADKNNRMPISMAERICDCTTQKILNRVTMADVSNPSPEKLKAVYADAILTCVKAEQ